MTIKEFVEKVRSGDVAADTVRPSTDATVNAAEGFATRVAGLETRRDSGSASRAVNNGQRDEVQSLLIRSSDGA